MKGEDTILLDIHEIASFTDYFIICSGTSERMIRSLSDAVIDVAAKYKLREKVEGLPGVGWSVIDLGDIVVHIFSPEQRSYYRLEQFWSQGKILVRLH